MMSNRSHLRRHPGRIAVALVFALTVPGASASADDPKDDRDEGAFGFSAPIACEEIRGYDDYKPLPRAELAADEKLLVYFLPRHFKSVRVGERFEAHLTQDVHIRRRGGKAVLWSKKDITDYRPREDTPPRFIFIRNTISLKGLKPGEYELDIVLHDQIGRSPEATRTLPFRVIATPKPGTPGNDDPSAAGP